jgi:hypothetical protein
MQHPPGVTVTSLPVTPVVDVNDPLSTKLPSKERSYTLEQNVFRLPRLSIQNITFPSPDQRPSMRAVPSASVPEPIR